MYRKLQKSVAIAMLRMVQNTVGVHENNTYLTWKK